MGARGRPSLKISPEERLERRRAQLAESQRKCRARKRASLAGKQGSRGSSASASPLSPTSGDTQTEDRDMEGGEVENSGLGLHPHTDTNRGSFVVSDAAPASDSDLSNQVPKAHFADMKPEQAVPFGDSTAFQPWSSDLDCLLEGNWDSLVDTALMGFEYDDHIQPDMVAGTTGEYVDQSPNTFGPLSYGLSHTDDSPSLSPLTLPFPQGAVPFDQHHIVGSTPADFVLFDFDWDMWNMNAPADASPNIDTYVHGSPTQQTNPNEPFLETNKFLDVLSPTSNFDSTMSEFEACYWQLGDTSTSLGDFTTADT